MRQLFLLHFAGGNRYSFDFLIPKLRELCPYLEIYPLELPGRGKRYDEALLLDKELAIKDFIVQIEEKRNGKPYCIYGHSMGGTLGYSVINQMERKGDPPKQFIVSGNPGPGIKESQRNENGESILKHLLNDNEFKDYLRKLGGVEEEVLNNNEIYNFFSPILRADFQLLENGESEPPHSRINVAIHAIMGGEEDYSEEISNWKNYTTSNCNFELLKGNHFFIYDHIDILSRIIATYCNKI